jgi:hypothetical protein
LDTDVGLSSLVEDRERELLNIGLHLRIIEFATDKTLGVEDTKVG